ncbi:hypothetical protein Avbf_16245 [Armadillidium vulgare]|nr:hypothetical protein Avbf_16245 [Armadillidium vulgare]
MTKMKITIFLLVLLISLDSVQETFGRNRGSKMSNFWRTKLIRKRNSETGDERTSRQTAQAESPSSSPNQTRAQSRPTSADCKEPGFFPTPGSCLHFYRCVDSRHDGSFYSVFHFTCPVGTVFDDSLDVCNYPHAAKNKECSDKGQKPPYFANSTSTKQGENITIPSSSSNTSKPTDKQTSPGASNLTCNTNTSYKRHPQFCNQYYHCINEKEANITILTCTLGLVFDENNQTCSRGVVGKTGLPEHFLFSVTKVLELAHSRMRREQVPGFSRNLEE